MNHLDPLGLPTVVVNAVTWIIVFTVQKSATYCLAKKDKNLGNFICRWGKKRIFGNKIGVINDPLGQTHSTANSNNIFHSIFVIIFWKVWTDIRTIITGSDYGSAEWINIWPQICCERPKKELQKKYRQSLAFLFALLWLNNHNFVFLSTFFKPKLFVQETKSVPIFYTKVHIY